MREVRKSGSAVGDIAGEDPAGLGSRELSRARRVRVDGGVDALSTLIKMP